MGCIHTCYGLESDYVGTIIGDDMVYEDGHIVIDYYKMGFNRSTFKKITKGIEKYGRKLLLEKYSEITLQ